MQRKRRTRDWVQPALNLHPQPYVPLVTRETPGLIDAVAALLLAAVGVPQVEGPLESGGVDEQVIPPPCDHDSRGGIPKSVEIGALHSSQQL